MSKKNETADTNALSEIEKALAEKMKGMNPVAPELHAHRPEIDGKPNPICGILVGKRNVVYKDGREGSMFVIATTLDTMLWDRDEDEAFLAPKGTYALVPERADLAQLNSYLPSIGINGFESVVEVVIVPKKKVSIGGGRTMWKFEIHGRSIAPDQAGVALIAAPTSKPVKALPAAETSISDDLPF